MGKGKSYNPSAKGMLRTREYVRDCLSEYELPLMTGPLLVIAHYKFPAPNSQPERIRKRLHLHPHAKRPDGDNLEKFLNDALKGIIWDDDAKISWLLRTKSLTTDKEGSTTIFVRELEPTEPDYPLIITDILENIELKDESMDLPTKSQSIYSQLKILEPSMRYIKDSLGESEFQDLDIFSECSLICAHLKSLLAKIEHTAIKSRLGDESN